MKNLNFVMIDGKPLIVLQPFDLEEEFQEWQEHDKGCNPFIQTITFKEWLVFSRLTREPTEDEMSRFLLQRLGP